MIQKIKLENIELAINNPRIKNIENIDQNLLESIREENLKNYNEKEVIKKLFFLEGDFSKLITLLKNIKSMGFQTQQDPIILIRKNQNNNYSEEKFVVAEGNRRIMVLKMIQNNSLLPEFEDNFNENENSDDDDQNYDWMDEKLGKKRAENYSKIKSMINMTIPIIEKTFLDKSKGEFNIVDDEKSLWVFLYGKHVSGSKPGLKQWGRGKYFVDLLKIFKEKGIQENLPEEEQETLNTKLLFKLQRDIKNLKSDFKYAQFVKLIFRYGLNTEDENKIYEKMNVNKVSALQYNFSIKKIKDFALKKRYLNNSNEFEEKYFKYDFLKNSILQIDESKKIDKSNLFKFIYKWGVENNVLTTRNIIDEENELFSDDIRKLFLGKKINENFEATIEEFYDKNLLKFSEKELEYGINLINTQENKEDHVDLLNNMISIWNLTKKTKNIKNTETSKYKTIFSHLHDQLKHNIVNDNEFLNARAATCRSLIEQFFVWSACWNFKILKYIIKDIDKKYEISKLDWKKDFSKTIFGKESKYFDEWTRKINSNVRILRNRIDNILKCEGGTTILKDNIPEAEFNAALSLFDKTQLDESWNTVNEFIHSSHKIKYSKKSTNLETYEKLIKIIDICDFIIKNIDNEKVQMIKKWSEE